MIFFWMSKRKSI